MTYHTTVLLHEGVEALNLKPGGIYVDATFGGGGHSKLILEKLQGGKLIAFDQDPDAERNAPIDPRLILCKANFRYLKNFLLANGISKVDGILADFGVSGYQFDEAKRGFSFRFDAELDMRMNPNQPLSAKNVLNEYEQPDLKRVFKEYGESPFAGSLATRIVQARTEKPFESINDLVKVIEKLIPEHKVKSELPKIFQAVRIEVNDEINALQDFLKSSAEVLNEGARLVMISYHSLEDRPVKHFLRSGNFEDKLDKDLYGNIKRPLEPVGKVITPSAEEIERNPRARSAKMRIGVKNSNG
ncbi:MAG: 16S rRNA (cytosine(1402)-N(4))-methyltransferase RsmH [Flavobacteriales bacterium]